ncbi:subtilase [Apiospora saccharicola]|uniref:Subtilase n=1 Tax=Apiospora saccharicola TaxID=335842 RepID=A0ABR1U4W8_9PEZI
MLSASASIADLHAFIQASSLLYRVFLLFKTAILLEVSGRDEGIVVRDYVAFSQVEFRGRFDDDYLDKTLKNIQRYQSLPPGRKATTVGVTARQAAYIIDFSRTVRFFIDLFTSNRFPILEAFVGQEAAAAPLSPGEYQRLSQALVRHQICLLFCVGRDRGDGDGDDTDAIDTDAIDTDAIVRRRFFGLFAPWEMEQVAAAHAFVFSVHRAWGKCTPKAERILDSERAQPLHQGERACLMTLLDAGRKELSVPSTYRGKFDVLLQSHGFPKIETSFEPPPFVAPPMSERDKECAKVRDALHRCEDAADRLVPGTSAGKPPFGWVDALRGLDAQRWGRDLPRCLPAASNEAQHLAARMRYAKWVWLGFVFWDKGRVELLKGGSTSGTILGGSWICRIR